MNINIEKHTEKVMKKLFKKKENKNEYFNKKTKLQ